MGTHSDVALGYWRLFDASRLWRENSEENELNSRASEEACLVQDGQVLQRQRPGSGEEAASVTPLLQLRSYPPGSGVQVPQQLTWDPLRVLPVVIVNR